MDDGIQAKIVEIDQPTTFGDIEIAWIGPHGADAAELVTADAYDG